MNQNEKLWQSGLEKTRKSTFGRLAAFLGLSQIDALTWDELESQLIQSDLGIDLTQKIIGSLKARVHELGITKQQDLHSLLKEELANRLFNPPDLNFDSSHPFVIMLVGVNGSGKTTTAAKLVKLFTQKGRKISLVAADTFRAAAVDQLQIWADRLGVHLTTAQPGSDPGAVVFDGIQSALARKLDMVIIDTAGRLHTRFNLMEELKKVYRSAGKILPGAPHAVWLVIDATTGQNALQQAKAFTEAVKVTGIILAKLDTSSKGGMTFAINDRLGLPVLYAGLGEKPEDISPFDKTQFLESILTS